MDNSTSLQEDHKERKDNYFVWLFKQLHGWPVQNYMLWFFAFGFQLAILIQNKITTLTVITFIGTLLGTLCVLAINATKAINGWLGLISAACFIYAGLAAKNYLSIFEQIAYILTWDLTVIISVRSWNDDTKNHLRKFGAKEWIIAIIGTLIVYAVSGYLIGKFTNFAEALFLGSNIGGFGSIVGSMANMLVFKSFVENGTVSKRKFFWVFSVLEFAGLIILTILGWIVLDFVI